MSDTGATPIRIFISGACAGLAEARDTLAGSAGIELVGTASEPAKAGTKYATTGAQVVVHALQRPDHVPIEDIEAIREHTSAPIVLLTTRTTPSLLEEAVEYGISDVILLPQMPDSLVFSIRKAHAMGMHASRSGGRRNSDGCKVITLFSPKGGTGKTTLAANMGATYARRMNKRTLVIDLDLQFGDLAIAVRAEPRTTILDLVMAHGELDPDKVAGFVTHHESGMDILPAPIRPEDAEMVTDDRLASLLTAARQSYDVIIIDTPPNFNSTVLTALDRTDELLLIASLDVPAIKSVKVCLQTLGMLHYPLERCHVLLNRADTRVGLRKDDIEQVLGRQVAFGIPSNKAVPTSVNRGIPVVMSDPKADVTRAIESMCTALSPDTGSAAAPAARRTRTPRTRKQRSKDVPVAVAAQLELGILDDAGQAA